jgi:ATP adenylyltransferase
MIDSIWSGWRSQYISGLESVVLGEGRRHSGGQSIFRMILESDLSDEETYIVHRGSKVFTIMNSFPYSVGHVLVIPYRQVPEISDLDPDEFQELWAEVEVVVSVIRNALGPDGFNIGLNLGAASGGSVSEHLHVHVVPRWYGDANFMVSTASVKAIPEALDVTAHRLRSAWSVRKNEGPKE